MTTLNEAKEGILKHFVDGWADRTAIHIDNEQFDTTDQKEQVGSGDDSPWVDIRIRHTGANQESLGGPGNRKFQRLGQAVINIYTACDIGTQVADNLTQDVLDIFEGISIPDTTVRFNQVVPTEVGVLNGTDWYLVVVTALFVYDEVK